MLRIGASVGKGASNAKSDVTAVQAALREAGFYTGLSDGVYSAALEDAIIAFQAIFVAKPDGRIDVNGNSHKFLDRWQKKQVKGAVLLPGNLLRGWTLLNPILPAGAYCTSGYRSTDDQRRILNGFYTGKYRAQIIKTYGEKDFDAVLAMAEGAEKDRKMTEMVRSTGQKIAVPGTSPHERGKAFDIGGPQDAEQARTARMVAKANPDLFNGRVLVETNGCVHVEVK